MDVTSLPLPGLKLITPDVFADSRGFFMEQYNEERYTRAGIEMRFVQDNHSRSTRDVLRGLHYQSTPGQDKLIWVISGSIFDVAVDLRPGSPTFGKWHGQKLDADSRQQLLIPVGFAHGYCITSDIAEVGYKSSSVYNGATERGLQWDDPDLAITWPTGAPILSDRDRHNESFKDLCKRLQT